MTRRSLYVEGQSDGKRVRASHWCIALGLCCLFSWFVGCGSGERLDEVHKESSGTDGGARQDTWRVADTAPASDVTGTSDASATRDTLAKDDGETRDVSSRESRVTPERPTPPERTAPPERRAPPDVHAMKCSGKPNPGGKGATLPTIPSKEYVIELKRWKISNNGTNAIATTDNLQKAIDWAASQKYGRVKIPAGTYLIGKKTSKIYSGGITLHSGMALVMDAKTVLQMVKNDTWNYSMIAVRGKKNVAIIGGTLRGDRENHIFAGGGAHDEGHGIEIKASQYVLVDGVTITKTTGDGILLVGQKLSSGSVSARDVTIRNCEFHDNRRQGVSIVGGIDILIHDNNIHHIKGTSPQFGIDIESLSFTSKDIIIRKNRFSFNAGGDIVNTDGRNVLIEDNAMEEGEGSRNIDGPIVFWNRADQTIRGNTLKVRKGSVNGKVGILGYSNKKARGNTAKTCIYDNVCDGCGFYIYHTDTFEVRDNQFLNGYIAMQYIKNIALFGNRVTHSSKRWAYRFKVVTGKAGGNLYNGKAMDIPLSDKPWTGAWID